MVYVDRYIITKNSFVKIDEGPLSPLIPSGSVRGSSRPVKEEKHQDSQAR